MYTILVPKNHQFGDSSMADRTEQPWIKIMHKLPNYFLGNSKIILVVVDQKVLREESSHL